MGVGKTYIVRNALSNDKARTLYISLAGISSSEEIIKAMYMEAFPVLQSKKLQTFGSIAKTIAGAFRVKSDLKMKDLIELDKFEILIFDDLERALLPMKKLLGFINNFIEHDKKHVIVIGNEDELNNDKDFSVTKEKIIGFTLSVSPEPKPVIEKTADKLPNKIGTYIQNHADKIGSTFIELDNANLRVLEYALTDFREIYLELDSHGISDEEKNQFLNPFLVITMAYRMGEINRSDIRNRIVDGYALALRQHNDNHSPDKFDILERRITSVDLRSTMLDNEYLEKKICDGFHDSELISRTISDFIGRSRPESNPEWRNLWYLIHQKEDVIYESIERLKDKWKKKAYLEAGEILHVFGIFLRLKNAHLITESKSVLLKQFRQYVDHLFNSRKFPIWHDEYDLTIRLGSAYGLGFSCEKDPTFIKAFNYFNNKSIEYKKLNIVGELKSVFESESFDIENLKNIILQNDYKNNSYGKPYLCEIDVNIAFYCIKNQNGELRFKIIEALGYRYYQNPYDEVLKKEGPWIKRLVKLLKDNARHESAVEQFRLKEILSWQLNDFLKKYGQKPKPKSR